MSNIVRDLARKELRRREWASKRGKATRTYLRDHSELAEQFELEGTIDAPEELPKYVTRASLILELNQRARRREASQAAKAWIKKHPELAKGIAEEVKGGN